MMETTSQPGHEVAKEVERMLAEGVLKQTSDGELYLTEMGHPNNAKEAAFSSVLDKHPALKGKQSELPDKVQAGIIKKKLRPRSPSARERFIASRTTKKAASTESQLLQALSAEGGAAGMKALRKRVKEDDLEQSLKALISSGKVRRHPDGDLIKESSKKKDHSSSQKKTVGRGILGAGVGGAVGHDISPSISRNALKTEQRELRSIIADPKAKFLDRRRAAMILGITKSRRKGILAKNTGRIRGYVVPAGVAAGAMAANLRPKKDAEKVLPDALVEKKAAATATKTDPAKWEAAKSEAKSKMGGKHSARAMQLATQIYKKKGGGYSGAKPTSQNNSLKKWGKQKWQYSGKDKPGPGGSGVYLPKKKQDRLRDSEKGRTLLARAARKKSEATRKGQQYSSHGLASGTSLKGKK
jgi:hypothetical protein